MLEIARKRPNSRECGDCQVCCFVSEVREPGRFFKGKMQACMYQCARGCSLAGTEIRPNICTQFNCSWMNGAGRENDRPDLSAVMVSVNNLNGGNWIFVMEVGTNALVKTGVGIVRQVAEQVPLPVIVVDFKHLKDGAGNRIVVRRDLIKRTKKVRGKFLGHLGAGAEYGIYELVTGG